MRMPSLSFTSGTAIQPSVLLMAGYQRMNEHTSVPAGRRPRNGPARYRVPSESNRSLLCVRLHNCCCVPAWMPGHGPMDACLCQHRCLPDPAHPRARNTSHLNTVTRAAVPPDPSGAGTSTDVPAPHSAADGTVPPTMSGSMQMDGSAPKPSMTWQGGTGVKEGRGVRSSLCKQAKEQSITCNAALGMPMCRDRSRVSVAAGSVHSGVWGAAWCVVGRGMVYGRCQQAREQGSFCK
eukprot:363781-Chlamydomonas_euryale.AAC.11